MSWLRQTVARKKWLLCGALLSVVLVAIDYPDRLSGWTLIAAIGLGANVLALLMDSLHSVQQRQIDELLNLCEEQDRLLGRLLRGKP